MIRNLEETVGASPKGQPADHRGFYDGLVVSLVA